MLPDPLQVVPLRAFTDNYIWMLHTPRDARQVIVVDPGDANPVQRALQANDLKLAAILITHHHMDHIGGVASLVSDYAVPVYGPAREKIPGSAHALHEGDVVALDHLGLKFQVLDVPGHTAGHIAYYGHGAIFCGDTLFSGGCGRLFEGTAEQMTTSLAKLARLNGNTLVYCTHEYTLSNLRFARTVEPNNRALADYQVSCTDKRERDEPTVPSTIALEHSVNPFFRCEVESVKHAAEAHVGHALQSTTEVFAAVRAWKDTFK